MGLTDSALIVLGALEHMSVERDRERLQSTLLRILAGLSGAEQAALFVRVGQVFQPLLIAESNEEPHPVGPEDFVLMEPAALAKSLRALATGGGTADTLIVDDTVVFHGLRNGHGLDSIVALRYAHAGTMRPWWIGSVLKVFENHINLINDAECDTLTGLFNRKTFEERFNRVLAMQRDLHANPVFGIGERRAIRADEHHWIAMVDIDHFKNVNDTFGHLYGDEVLILLARLMMRCFRLEDRLFRFGGEEFVIVLSPCTAPAAAMVLERFRRNIEKHNFPQVGRVTISTGYTRIKLDDMPSVAIGRGDEALYYAKRNGRNRVCCYEQLAASGEMHAPTTFNTEVTLF